MEYGWDNGKNGCAPGWVTGKRDGEKRGALAKIGEIDVHTVW